VWAVWRAAMVAVVYLNGGASGYSLRLVLLFAVLTDNACLVLVI